MMIVMPFTTKQTGMYLIEPQHTKAHYLTHQRDPAFLSAKILTSESFSIQLFK